MNDKDLLFLNDCTNDQLKTLVDILVFDKDGKMRVTESLSNTKLFNECYPDNLRPMVPEIINEIQLFGGNTIANKLRGHGVPYREILEDVCDKLKVNYHKSLPVELVENELLRSIAISVVDKMTDADVKQFNSELDKTRLMKEVADGKAAAILPISAIVVGQFIKQSGKIIGAVGLGGLFVSRFAAMAIPVINALASLWLIANLTSPAYRVTVPFTIAIAFYRKINSTNEAVLKEIFE